MNCKYHLCENKITDTRWNRKFCDRSCKGKFFVTQNRKNTKIRAVAYKGGECQLCGYSKCLSALHFHHKDPEQKDFSISGKGSNIAWDKTKRELDKCILVCANCHSEIHSGLVDISC